MLLRLLLPLLLTPLTLTVLLFCSDLLGTIPTYAAVNFGNENGPSYIGMTSPAPSGNSGLAPNYWYMGMPSPAPYGNPGIAQNYSHMGMPPPAPYGNSGFAPNFSTLDPNVPGFPGRHAVTTPGLWMQSPAPSAFGNPLAYPYPLQSGGIPSAPGHYNSSVANLVSLARYVTLRCCFC